MISQWTKLQFDLGSILYILTPPSMTPEDAVSAFLMMEEDLFIEV